MLAFCTSLGNIRQVPDSKTLGFFNSLATLSILSPDLKKVKDYAVYSQDKRMNIYFTVL